MISNNSYLFYSKTLLIFGHLSHKGARLHLDHLMIKDFVQYAYHVASHIPYKSQTAKSTTTRCSGPNNQLDLKGLFAKSKRQEVVPDLQNRFQIELARRVMKHYISNKIQSLSCLAHRNVKIILAMI